MPEPNGLPDVSPPVSPGFAPGTLWDQVQEQTRHALDCGALQSIPTHYEFLEDEGLSFLVRSLDSLSRKQKAQKQQEQARQQGKRPNPFLPYEPDLFVSHLSDTHLCLLNKYNVVDHHLLIVTRAYEEQECWLNLKDFEALWYCMAEINGLAFYNGGKVAGASQPHKHLQLVPLPLSPKGAPIPVEPLLTNAAGEKDSNQPLDLTAALPFHHGVLPLDLDPTMPTESAIHQLLMAYHQLLKGVGLVNEAVTGDRQTGAYNLLVTRRWMLLVPRSQESFASISVNSLGFAGSLFVSNEEQMKILKQQGPMTLLKHVAYPANPDLHPSDFQT